MTLRASRMAVQGGDSQKKKKIIRISLVVHAEISFDLDSDQCPDMLEKWGEVQKMMGATEESLQKLPEQLRNMLTVLPPDETEKQIKLGGLSNPIRFFQALMVCGWFAKKE